MLFPQLFHFLKDRTEIGSAPALDGNCFTVSFPFFRRMDHRDILHEAVALDQADVPSGKEVFFFFKNAACLTEKFCYDFFFVSGQIYTNSKAGEKYKSAAQGLITLATYGVGMLIGFGVAGWITDNYKTMEGKIDWEMVWIIPAGIAITVFILFALLFNEKTKTETN